jgi:U3 small nucleolar RNA-associated protein MPP10
MESALFYMYFFVPSLQPSVEIKIVTNLPTISIEEVGPTAVTDSSLLAPQEILGKCNLH